MFIRLFGTRTLTTFFSAVAFLPAVDLTEAEAKEGFTLIYYAKRTF